MYFTQAVLEADAGRHPEFQELTTNGYLAHQLVWRLFSDHPDRTRDFIYRWDLDKRRPTMFIVSERQPTSSEIMKIRTKSYEPTLKVGDIYKFALRANPVIKKRDENGKQRVHDVVMNAKWEMKQAGDWNDANLSQAELVQREGIKWLEQRCEDHGFKIDDDVAQADGYRKHQFRKNQNGRQVTFCTIDYWGVLKVQEPEKFREVLYSGLGPSKAFGCGLIMIKNL